MSGIYDNWERLVAAVLRREQDREIARCDSLSDSISSDFSSRISSSSSSLEDPSVSKSAARGIDAGRIAARAARLLSSPAIAFARYRRRRLRDLFFDVSGQKQGGVRRRRNLKRFYLPELQVATDNFSDKNIISRGEFNIVYKGRLADGSLVAIQRLDEQTIRGDNQFKNDAELLCNTLVHRNVLPLRGFCMTSAERLLVYPFMTNGNVASWLRGRPKSQRPLDWPMRKRIALGAAKGLAYMHEHCDPKIIHRDVRVANIFLNEDFETLVGNFWIAKPMDYKNTHVTTNLVCGTIGHIAPEYMSDGKYSEKSDVFGYGAMLLELITAQRVSYLAELANDQLFNWIKGLVNGKELETLVDVNLQGNNIDAEVEQLIRVALLCMQRSPRRRPKMSEVARILEGGGFGERWHEWQKEKLSGQDEHDM